MTVALETLDRLAVEVNRRLDGSGAHVVSVTAPDPAGIELLHQILLGMMRSDIGIDVQPVEIVLQGWGGSLEAYTKTIPCGVGIKDPDTAVSTAISHRFIANPLEDQHNLCAIAHQAGIAQPLRGDDIYSTRHLLCDAVAMQIYVETAGSTAAARRALDEDMSRHAHIHGGTYRSIRPFQHPSIRIYGRRLVIGIEITNDGGRHLRYAPDVEGVHTVIHWDDDDVTISPSIVLPETVLGALPGRLIGDIASGTPIGGHRIIEVPDTRKPSNIDAGTILRIATQDVAVDAVLGPQGPRTLMEN